MLNKLMILCSTYDPINYVVLKTATTAIKSHFPPSGYLSKLGIPYLQEGLGAVHRACQIFARACQMLLWPVTKKAVPI